MTATATPGKFKFRLNFGKYRRIKGRDPLTGRAIYQNFGPGDIIETDQNLGEIFNNYPRDPKTGKIMPGRGPIPPNKFDAVQEVVPIIKTVVIDLESMSIEELRGYARDEEIEVPEAAKSKGDVLRAIRSARAVRT